MPLVSMNERYSAAVKVISAGQVSSLNDRHALVLWFRGGPAIEQGETAGAWVDPPSQTTGSTTSTTGGSNGTTNSTHPSEDPTHLPQSPDCYETSYAAYISAPEGVLAGGNPGNIAVRAAEPAHGLPEMIGSAYIPWYGKMPFVIHGAGALQGKQVTVLTVEYIGPKTPLPEGCTSGGTSATYTKIVYQIEKHLCDDASVDTRKAFGESNSQGELTPDPNAAATELNFGTWGYKGGLFVGQLPPVYDRSGAAKVQLYPNLPDNVATLSVFSLKRHPSFNDAMVVGAFVPSASDPNLLTGAASVRWPTRWNVGGQTETGAAINANTDHGTAVSKTEFQFDAANDYGDWPLARIFDTGSFIRPASRKAISLGMTTPTYGSGAQNWHYFASKEYPGVNAVADPRQTDLAPRVWTARIVSTERWTGSTGTSTGTSTAGGGL